MCGIFCGISAFCANYKNGIDTIKKILQEKNSLTKQLLKNRGPDYEQFMEYQSQLFLWSTVLWQQGTELCKQPVESARSILLYNGDMFLRDELLEKQSDTNWLHKKLDCCATIGQILELFRIIKGPYSIIYLDKIEQKLYIIRDSLGRNSLLLSKSDDLVFISSVTPSNNLPKENILELPCLGVFRCDLSRNNMNLELYPWQRIDLHDYYAEQLQSIRNFLNIEIIVHETIDPVWLRKKSSKCNFNFQEVMQQIDNDTDIFPYLLNIQNINEACEKTIHLLRSSVAERIHNTPEKCAQCLNKTDDNIICNHTRIGVLFSGGIDCSIISVLANEVVPENIPIDLMNVAFEKVRREKNQNAAIDWNVPDRISAQNTLTELQTLAPNRKWNFVEINIKRSELDERLSQHITHLVSPLVSILDESLGAALWFAASGKGTLINEPYESHCRVILTGSGADELFGGYTRHRNAFLRESKEGNNPTLDEELLLDWVRLPSRNLARDDRVIADHSVTPRTPFIQEDFVHFVRNLETFQKCFHGLEQGVGDKLLLRLCAYKLGLRACASMKKRALQFGSRIADRKQNAKDVSIKLL